MSKKWFILVVVSTISLSEGMQHSAILLLEAHMPRGDLTGTSVLAFASIQTHTHAPALAPGA